LFRFNFILTLDSHYVLTLADVEKLKIRKSQRGPDKGAKYGKRKTEG
jgi:hypothetical protein